MSRTWGIEGGSYRTLVIFMFINRVWAKGRDRKKGQGRSLGPWWSLRSWLIGKYRSALEQVLPCSRERDKGLGLIRSERLEPEKVKGKPLCMASYKYL